MEEMEGRLDADAHHILVQSAAAAQFNSKLQSVLSIGAHACR